MRNKLLVVLGVWTVLGLAALSLADQETLNGADSNTITVLDPRKLTRASPNINPAAINSLTGSSSAPSSDGKSNETTLVFATHVTETTAPQLETHAELNNQLGQTVYLQAQPQPHQPSQHPAGQFLYPQPSPVHAANLASNQAGLGASPPYLLHPGYGVQYVQYVPRPVVMPNYPPPPSVYGHHAGQYSSLQSYTPHVPHHHQSPHLHPSGYPQSAQYILPPPPGHHTIPSPNNYHQGHGQGHQQSLQPSHHHQPQPQQQFQFPGQSHQSHHPQTHFLAGPQSPQSQPPVQHQPQSSTYVSGSSAVPAQSQQSPLGQQHQLHAHQAQASSPSSYLTYSSPSHHYHSSVQPQVQHSHHQTVSPTAQSSNIIASHVQAPQQQSQQTLQQQITPQQQQPQHLIGSYSHQSPLYSYVQSPQAPRYSESFLNTNEYLPSPVQYDNSQFRAIKRHSKA